jgi:hypothetical protein
MLLSHCKNGYTSTPQYYVIRTLPVLPDTETLQQYVSALTILHLNMGEGSNLEDLCINPYPSNVVNIVRS